MVLEPPKPDPSFTKPGAMDPMRTPRMNNKGGAPMPRNNRLAIVLFGVAVTGVAAAQFMLTRPEHTPQVQKNGQQPPNLHVSVDRSGGGV
ncbi:Uu.00g051710.m01.CDS01 [Anthostomella pinea]|uniref:Uu.00g051710.m01.CDS01 n=1 Tax=Anthostomella pinea TaxID=933095 RepID=A0AAI8YPH2_9PEZI|nr:Uu.00g051710.m01.CDS01 [Anthostomella pinea]